MSPAVHDTITVSGIAAIGHHGVFDHERRDGQTFVADVTLHVDSRPAAAADSLALTVDYGLVSEQVAAVLSGEPADLVETVAERIAAAVLTHPGVHAVDVVVHKPQAPVPVPFTDVTVRIHRDREHVPSVAGLPVVIGPSGDDGGAVAAEDDEQRPTEQQRTEPGREQGAEDPASVPTWSPTGVGTAPFGTGAAPLPGAAPAAEPTSGRAPEATAVLPVESDPGRHARLDADPTVPVDGAALAQASLPPAPGGQGPGDRMDVAPAEPVEVVLALGSNLGASHDLLRRAVHELADVPGLEITAIAPLARTGPVGGPPQPDFLNTVVVGTTWLSPRALLHACQRVEDSLGRERAERWGPRTVDIDVIVHGSTVGSADDLELPHPRAHERAFVLQPWAQVRPDAVLPGLGGGPVAVLADTAPDRGGIRWMALDWWAAREGGA